MTFEEAGQQYAILRQQRDLGQIPDAQYRQAVSQLMVVDAQGSYWCLDADSGQWMTYNGTAWVMPNTAEQAQLVAKAQPVHPAAARESKTSWGQRVWDVLSVTGNAMMSAAWYWYSGLADTKADVKTCVAMLVLPIVLIVFRKPLDNLLRPLDKLRCKIPPMVLAGVGVAVPFLVANYLYSRGETQFPFMFKTYVYSTLLSYIVLKTPFGGRMMAPTGVSTQTGAI
ncbi:MAG: hypothetical protein V1844_24870 [Pseudomonadota bacterium]